MTEKKTADEIGVTALKKLGFTESLIAELLPPPHDKVSGYYVTSRKVWNRSDVEAAMKQPRFTERLDQLADRRKRTEEASRPDESVDLAEAVDRAIPRIRVRFERDARHMALLARLEENRRLGKTDEAEVLEAPAYAGDRWEVNFIRRSLTEYDAALYRRTGRPAEMEQRMRYRAAVLDAVAAAYPKLREECERQKQGWED